MRLLLIDPASFTPQYDHERLGSRPRRYGSRAAHVAVSLRRPAAARRIHALRDLLSRRKPGLRTLTRAAPAQGGRAFDRTDPHPLAAWTNRPSPVAGRARDRQPHPPHAPPLGLHRPRSPAAPHRDEARAVEEAARPVLPRDRPQRAWPRDAHAAGIEPDRLRFSPTRSSRATRRVRTTVRRFCRSASSDRTGPRRHDRGCRPCAGREAARRRRSARAGRRIPRSRRAVGRMAAGVRERGGDRRGARRGDGRRLPVQAGDRPERRAAARARGRSAGRGLRRRRDRGTRAALRGRTRRRGRERRGPGGGDPELLSEREALQRARQGALRARETLTWTAAAEAHMQLYEELR